MDPNSLAASTTKAARKVRFQPKAPPARREQKTVLVAKLENVEEAADATQKEVLLRRFNEGSLNVRPKIEKKVEPKVDAFRRPGSSSDHLNVKPNHGVKNGLDKEYKEPWEYHSYYPVTLPLRRPLSGDPELLDEEEFGVGSESQKYDEDFINAAKQLGLMDQGQEPTLLFLQLPSKLPMPKEHPGKDTDANGTASNKSCSSKNRGTLDELPSGYGGKLVVYKSGAVKLKLGDHLYDVASGVVSTFAQDVVSLNTKTRCNAVGELNKRAIITPDLDSMFDNKLDL